MAMSMRRKNQQDWWKAYNAFSRLEGEKDPSVTARMARLRKKRPPVEKRVKRKPPVTNLEDSFKTPEVEVQSLLYVRLLDKGVKVRLEQDVPGVSQRVDIAVFDESEKLVSIIEVKKHAEPGMLAEACNQCHRYRGSTGVPVYLVAGIHEAEMFVREWPNVSRYWYVHRQPDGILGKRVR